MASFEGHALPGKDYLHLGLPHHSKRHLVSKIKVILTSQAFALFYWDYF